MNSCASLLAAKALPAASREASVTSVMRDLVSMTTPLVFQAQQLTNLSRISESMARFLPRWARTAAVIVAVLVAFGYAGALGMLYLEQERLILPATTLSADYRFHFDQPFEEMWIAVQ